VGKGTLVRALMQRDPSLVLSRSWTTRERRDGEPEDAYHFTDRGAFEGRRDHGGFMEWTEFLGNYYGTPSPDVGDDERDLVLEIEVNGAAQVRAEHPESLLVFVLPPSRAEQRRRLVARGDPVDKVHARLKKAEDEEPIGRAMSDHIVVNDDLDATVEEILRIIDKRRQSGT
jgi:guanylate kinase